VDDVARLSIPRIQANEIPVPTAGGWPEGIAAGPDGNVWFTELFGGKIGKVILGQTSASSSDRPTGGTAMGVLNRGSIVASALWLGTADGRFPDVVRSQGLVDTDLIAAIVSSSGVLDGIGNNLIKTPRPSFGVVKRPNVAAGLTILGSP
jgi:hypothetical protein